MTWMLTAKGRNVDLRYIGHDALDIDTVAYALSNINRFAGHASRPISVAEHSVMCLQIAERHYNITSPSARLAVLMHDAHEALTGDVSQPMKELLGNAWAVAEERIQHAVLLQFGLSVAYGASRALIKACDLTALSAEREQLMPAGEQWPCQLSHPAPDWVRYGTSFTADDWRRTFKNRYADLMAEVQAHMAAIPQYQPHQPASAA